MPSLYLDMDGVLADFNLAATLVLNANELDRRTAVEQGRWPRPEWQRIRQNPNFYRTLPKTDIADQLVNLARQFRDQLNWKIAILTAIPRDNDMPEAFHDKIEWAQEYYPDLRVYFGPYSRDKSNHMTSAQDILVDDRPDNCRDWQSHGAKAIQVLDWDRPQAVKTLTEIFHQLNNNN